MAVHTVTCTCGVVFEAKHPRAKYHSDRCRKQASRTKRKRREVGPVEKTTRRELLAAKRLDTVTGQLCLVLARRLDNPGADTGSAVQSVAVRLQSMLDELTKGARPAGPTGPQAHKDELAARRAQHA